MKRRQQGILTGMPFMANLAPRTFVDDLGRKIYLAKVPTRILSLAPSVTEMLFALGAGDQVVAVTDFCDYPPEAGVKPKIGSARPNIEVLLGFKPDLVLSPQAFVGPDVLNKLEQLKIATYILEANTVEDILGQILTLGRMLDRVPAATEVTTSMRGKIQDVKVRTQSLPRPRVFYVLNSDPLITVGPGSFIHQLIELAGGINIAAGSQVAYPRFSMEEVLVQDPQVLLFPIGESEGIPDAEQQRWQRWTTLSAIKDGRVYRLPSVLLDRPGPRVVEGLDALAKALHPNALTHSTGH